MCDVLGIQNTAISQLGLEEADIHNLYVSTAIGLRSMAFINGSDLYDVLDIKQSANRQFGVEETDMYTIHVSAASGLRLMTFINESGLYQVMSQSRKENTKTDEKDTATIAALTTWSTRSSHRYYTCEHCIWITSKDRNPYILRKPV